MRLRAGSIGARIENLVSAVLVWTRVANGNREKTEGLGHRAFVVAGGVFAILAIDQATKMFAASRLTLGQSIEVLPGFLHLTLVRNTGMAFGLLSDFDVPFKTLLMTLLSVVALGAVVYYALRTPRNHRMTHAGLIFILGGALGNIADRARLGYVIDFIDVFYRDTHWPAFNFADSCICVGVGLLLLDSLRSSERAEEGQAEKGRSESEQVTN
jgi:signal peptidase II